MLLTSQIYIVQAIFHSLSIDYTRGISEGAVDRESILKDNPPLSGA